MLAKEEGALVYHLKRQHRILSNRLVADGLLLSALLTRALGASTCEKCGVLEPLHPS